MSRVEMDKTTYGQAQVWVMKCSHIKEKVCPTFWYLRGVGFMNSIQFGFLFVSLWEAPVHTCRTQ